MTVPLEAGLAILLGYLLGSVPTSYLAGRLFRGIDLRRHGSGNLGATNVYRILGPGPAAAVALVDIAKGVVAAAAVPGLFADVGRWSAAYATPSALPLACGMAAVLGHVFPVWLRFKGGKGVATGVGVFLALAPLATAVALVVWIGVLALTRVVSLASLALGVALPLLVVLEQRNAGERDWLLVGCAAAVTVFIFWTHRENLRRLRRGEERRISRATRSPG